MCALRVYQKQAVTKTLDYFREGNDGHPLIVLPTGAGKTHVLGGLCEEIHNRWPTVQIVILSHVQEILMQDYLALKQYLPKGKVGLYSAGLDSRQVRPYTVASIQSVYKKPEMFADHKVIIVDEAHLIPPSGEGRYRTFFDGLDNPRVIGLTATPFRLGLGMLTDGMFDKIVYEKDILELIKEGYLSPLTSKETTQQMSVRGISKTGGDFNNKQLANKLDKNSITQNIVRELLAHKDARKHWLVFAIDIDHAEHITQVLIDNGITAACVHSKMDTPRGDIIELYKACGFQALVSVETLTTGFDAPNVDLIALCRPTTSPVLYIQMVGRGLRIADGKENCLILDFAGNMERLGPINDVAIPTPGVTKGSGKARTRTCPECREINYLAARVCVCCGHEFPRESHLESHSSSADILGTRQTEVEILVSSVTYHKHIKKDSPPSLRIEYKCGMSKYKAWVPLEHLGWPGHKARHWWKYNVGTPVPRTIDEALSLIDTIPTPTTIVVDTSKKYPQVKQCKYHGVVE